MIPTAEELNAWVDGMKSGHAVTEMMPRFLEGYRRLLKVADAAEFARRFGYTPQYLKDALDTLSAPVPGETT